MLRNYFKATEDFQAPAYAEENRKSCEEFLVEKGDIIVDVKPLNHEYLMGKTLVSQKMIRIPKQCVEELKDDNDKDDMHSDERPSRCSSGDKDLHRRKSELSNEGCKRKSQISSHLESRPTSAAANSSEDGSKQTSREELTLEEIPDEYVPLNPQPGVTPHPKAPPRVKKKRDMAGETFRSRESDEGYNSCSHYSGERPPDSERITRSSYYNTPIGADVPVLTSFGESPQRISSPRPSIQDADGYEIPSFVQRASVVNGEVATGDEKGVTLKFIYQRKSTSVDEKFSESLPLNGQFRLGSIGEHSESIYETWDTDPKVSSSLDDKKSARKDRFLVLLFFAVSIAISLGLFFVLLFVLNTAALLSFAAAANLFAVIFVGLLTMGKRRWLCIATLLAPSLFSKKVKIGLCLTLCVLIIAGPICNISNNIKVVLNCKNYVHNDSQSALHTRLIVQENQVSSQTDDPNIFSTRPNTTAPLNEARAILQQCESTLRNALETSVSGSCDEKDAACVIKTFQPHFGELCKNLSESRLVQPPAKYKLKRDYQKVPRPSFKFKFILLQLLPLLLVLILHEAYWYNRDYLSNKEVDNVYITGKLKALDHDRKERGMKNRLFPLRKLEFRTYILPSSFFQTSQEIKEVLRWVIVWISFGLAVLLCILLDKYVNEVLSFLAANSLSNCDMKFSTLDQNIVYSFCIILALLIVAVIFQSYVLRSRSRICSYFYPKKESARGVFLYHKILRDRKVFWQACKERGKMMSEGRRTRWKIGVGHRVFRAMPTPARTLLEKMFVYRCMICNTRTFRRTFICSDEDCFATFCYECFIDMGQSCISCRPCGARDSVFTSV